MERRDFLLNSCRACLGVMAIPVLASLESCSGGKALTSLTEANGTVSFPASELATQNAVLLKPKSVPDGLLVLKQPSGGYIAVVPTCTHRGGPVHEEEGHLKCSLHGSLFDLQGHVTKGPAKLPLKSYPVEEKNGMLSIVVG